MCDMQFDNQTFYLLAINFRWCREWVDARFETLKYQDTHF